MKELLPRQTEAEFHEIFLEAYHKTKLKHAKKNKRRYRIQKTPVKYCD